MDGVDTETLITGAPLIKGGLSWLDCRVTQTIPVGTNTLFLAEVVAAQNRADGLPLATSKRRVGCRWSITIVTIIV